MVNRLSGIDWGSLGSLWDIGSFADLSDGELLARFVGRRDESAELAFEVLVRRHGPMVLRISEQLLVDRHAAEDVFQAVFLVLAHKAGSIQRPEQLGPWLHGVAVRTAKESRSREIKRRRLERRGATMPPPTSNRPEQRLDRVEEAQALHSEIAWLPERYRSPVVLCDLEGLTHQEAASRLRCPTGTIAIRLKRARERLRDRLARRGFDPSSDLMVLALDPGKLPALSMRLVRSTVPAYISAGIPSASVVSLAKRVHVTMILANWKIATVGLALVLGLVAAWGAPVGLPAGPKEAPVQVSPEVEFGRPIVREVSDYGSYVGRTDAARFQEIRSNAGGMMETVVFPEGSRIKAGELLFEIDRKESQALLDLADSSVLKPEAHLNVALAALEQKKQLQAQKRIEQDEIDIASAKVAVAKATLRVAEEARNQARMTLDSTRIKATFDGVVSRSLVQPGDRIKAGETLLAKLEATDPIAVSFDIDERTLLRLRRQMRDGLIALPVQAALVGEEDFPHHGTARLLGSEPIDANTGSVRLRATVPNPDHLMRPGMFVRVRLTTCEPHQAMLVPESAILTVEGRTGLYVISDRDIVEARPVTVGNLHDDLRVIREGLKSGDRVVVGSLKDIHPGMAVKPRPAP